MNGDTSDDWFSGAYGDDVIDGGDGADILDGGPDNDTIDGGDGGDMIYGGSGNDTLNGDDGDDFLHGESGDDDMTGGAGADTFLFLRNATDDEDPDTDPDPIFGHGNDVIWDYDPLEDELHFLTNEDFVPQLSDDSGNTTVTYADDSSIVLMNIVIDDLLDLNATVIVDPDLFTV
jgi:Ca2+-binding RTX toxin-like protein